MIRFKIARRGKGLIFILIAGCFLYPLLFYHSPIEKRKRDNPSSYIQLPQSFHVSDIRELEFLGKTNFPLRKTVLTWNLRDKNFSDLAKDFHLAEKEFSRTFPINDTRRIVMKYVSNDETFLNKENVAKLMLLANFIEKGQENTGLGWDQFKEALTPQNFAGTRFLFQNVKDDLMKQEQLVAMSAAVNLTEFDIQVLKNIKPAEGKKRSPRKQLQVHREKNLAPWQILHNGITQYELYRDNAVVDKVIHDMRIQKIKEIVDLRDQGTQIKFALIFEDGSKVMFKPKRFPSSQETLPNDVYFTDYERHTSEIASFYVDRVLGFHHVSPVVGRKFSLSDDIIPHLSDATKRTFFESPSGDLCFFADCDYYCDPAHAICGHSDIIDGSAAFYLPFSQSIKKTSWKNPWQRTYDRHHKAKWQVTDMYCDSVRNISLYKDERRLLDLMDMAIFDFFIGNPDRHHFDTFTSFDNDTRPVYYDNGRGFGRAFYDDMSILKPLTQCCLIRYSTLKTLVQFNDGPTKLSDTMRHAMADDILAPVLTDQLLLALDRRVKIVLKEITKCIDKTGTKKKVVIHIG